MKLEPRGKYAGVKIHLDGEEVKALLEGVGGPYPAVPPPLDDASLEEKLKEIVKKSVLTSGIDVKWVKVPGTFMVDLYNHIKALMKEEPDLLEDKSPEKVAEVLQYEADKAAEKLIKLKEGGEWQKVKPKGWAKPGVKA